MAHFLIGSRSFIHLIKDWEPDFLFTFPVQVLEDEQIDGNYCLCYFEAEKAYLRLINFFVCIIKSLV